MELVYVDDDIVVCRKEPGQLSTDEPGGVPEAVRALLGTAEARTVHRLDRVVGGLMVLARNKNAASQLSLQIREGTFQKAYTAVVHGCPDAPEGTYRDLLCRDKQERKTYVTETPGKDVREAILDYRVLGESRGLSRVDITLRTGRTHQIRAQFSSRRMPLCGDRKYSLDPDDCPVALFSCFLSFSHPVTGKRMEFRMDPPDQFPWNLFEH